MKQFFADKAPLRNLQAIPSLKVTRCCRFTWDRSCWTHSHPMKPFKSFSTGVEQSYECTTTVPNIHLLHYGSKGSISATLPYKIYSDHCGNLTVKKVTKHKTL